MRQILEKFACCFTLLVAASLAAGSAFAQSNFGSLRGIVSDPQGAAIADATVTLTDQGTKIMRKTQSNKAGEYVFGAVAPGNYSVRVELSGFAKTDRSNIRLDAGNTLTVDLGLKLGGAADVVEVSSEEPQVDNGTSYNGQMVDAQKLQNLPNPGRNPFLFAKLDNAVTAVGDPRFVRFQDQSGSSTISVAGGPMSSNNYSIDGVPITDFSNRAVIIPSIEAVEEMKIQANTYDAEIGRTSGGMFNTTLRTGSTRLHGVLQGETRQTNWGANTFFNNRSSCTVKGVFYAQCPRGAAEFYSYVGSLSGPIPLPRWLGGKDATFFSITEEGYRQRSPYVNATQLVVPTELERKGDFSEIGNVVGGVCVSGTCVKNLLASTSTTPVYYEGNKITNINSIGQAILNYYPHPTSSVSAKGSPNFSGYDTLGDRADEFNGKVTHKFSDRWTAGFYYLHYGSKEPGGNALQNIPGSSSSYLLYRKVDAIGITNTITVNPTTVATVGFGFNRFPNDTQDISKGFDQATLGFSPTYLAALSKATFPAITSSDSSLVNEGTSNSGPVVFFSRNFVAGIVKSIGKHSVKLGYNYRAISETFTSLSNTSGTFGFNAMSGHSAADLLQGVPTTGSLVVPSQLAYTTAYQAIYLQDDWRATSRLTFNIGFRFEFENGIHERDNHISVGFDPNATYNAFGTGPQAKGGVMFAGQNGYGTHTSNMGARYNPRAGFAYQIDKNTVIKGGYGVFYAPEYYSNSNLYAPGYVLNNSISQGLGSTPGSLVTLSDPYPNLKTVPTGNANGLSTSIGTTLSLIDHLRRAPVFNSYSLQLEHQFWWGVAFKIGYIGGHGRNLPNSLNINQLPDTQYQANGGTLGASVTNQYAGYGSWGTGSVQKFQTLLPFPQYQAITLATSLGKSQYNAMDIKVTKQFSKGITLLAGYTWSSNWDNVWGAYGSSNSLNGGNNGPQDIYNLKSEYARATNNIPNRFTFAGSWELPFGQGKAFLSHGRLLNLIVGGWKFHDITVIQNGGPLAITQTSSISAYGNSTQRPTWNPSGGSPCKAGRPEDRLTGYFNTAAFTVTPGASAGTLPYGNVSRSVNCQGPGYINSDLSLNKDFRVTEHVHAEFRAEALNAFNTPQFATPSLNISSGAGVISGTLGFPRLVQLGGRLTF